MGLNYEKGKELEEQSKSTGEYLLGVLVIFEGYCWKSFPCTIQVKTKKKRSSQGPLSKSGGATPASGGMEDPWENNGLEASGVAPTEQ